MCRCICSIPLWIWILWMCMSFDIICLILSGFKVAIIWVIWSHAAFLVGVFLTYTQYTLGVISGLFQSSTKVHTDTIIMFTSTISSGYYMCFLGWRRAIYFGDIDNRDLHLILLIIEVSQNHMISIYMGISWTVFLSPEVFGSGIKCQLRVIRQDIYWTFSFYAR